MIVILTTGRAGSSMLGRILHFHGCWSGECRKEDEFNKEGYFENIELKKLLKKIYPTRNYCQEFQFKEEFTQGVKEIMRTQGYTEPGFFKHGACFWRLWNDFDVKFIKTFRPIEDIKKSYLKTGWWKEEDLGFIEYQQKLMERIPGIFVDTKELVKGDRSSIQKALEYCDVDYNNSLTSLAIRTDLYEIS